MRTKARVDANQAYIVKMLRLVGATVTPTHALGKGFPDICVGWEGYNFLFEIKDGDKPPSQRKLTPDEEDWHMQWRGQVVIINSAEEAIEYLKSM
jgi:hypothetical protein